MLWRETGSQRRAGFAVTRQVRGAVRRNRARRRLREAFRAVRKDAPIGVEVVIIGKRGALDEPFAQLATQMRDALSAIPGARTRT